ncbi:MAG: helicase C-terminal domain-containing protein [Chloroflexota bacterium]
MARVYVSLDLETTGLDTENDRIIEVGAVRFRGSRVLEKFQSFVNPRRTIPYQIQQLTGISNDMVADAPNFGQISARLKRFVGDHAIVGHNIEFDLKFLRKVGLFERSIGIDTFEIASILLPHADRYSLQALAHLLNIAEPPTHRALDDAIVTHQLFEALLDEARRLDQSIIKQVASLASPREWSLAPIFKDLARERSGAMTSILGQQLLNRQATYEQDYGPGLKPVIPPKPLDVDQVAQLLEPDGTFDQIFARFEYRPQQVDMLRNVVDAFNEPYHMLIEAGTGTGKSMAYLIPAIYWAIQNEHRVVISTNTINLQDQILTKDLPDLKRILNVEFRAVALKGRGNYVCPWRVEQLRQKENLSPAERRVLAKVAIWMPNTLTGDRQELFMPSFDEQRVWEQINSNPDFCRSERCVRGGCFFTRARQAAENAHIIVVNHALLLADISVNNRAIPEYRYLVVDEAHHLESSVTSQLSFSATKKSMEQMLNDLGQPKGSLFAKMLGLINAASIATAGKDMANIIQMSRQILNTANKNWYALFNALEQFMNQHARPSRGDYDRRLRISNAMRTQPSWNDIELGWDNTNTALNDVIKLVTTAGKLWDGLDSFDVDQWEETMVSLTNYRVQLEEVKSQVGLILGDGNQDTITWIEQKVRTEDIVLHAAPLHVGNLVRKHLFDSKDSIVLTSATLRTNNSFDYVKDRLGADDQGDLAVGSPFDYPQSALVYVPTDIPEPNSSGFQNAFDKTLINLAIATKGRLLVLFTSYSHLRTTSNNIRQRLANEDIALYQQGAGMGRRQMLDNFKSADKAVLMGTKSFWEGVDIPGPALSCVVIAKIPFAVPSDPIYQARSETFDDSFNEYSIPEAILQFRQGFGRLIRTRSDRGVVVIMDKRVVSKGYGHTFIDSLPEATVRQGSSVDLPEIAAQWIDHPEIHD